MTGFLSSRIAFGIPDEICIKFTEKGSARAGETGGALRKRSGISSSLGPGDVQRLRRGDGDIGCVASGGEGL